MPNYKQSGLIKPLSTQLLSIFMHYQLSIKRMQHGNLQGYSLLRQKAVSHNNSGCENFSNEIIVNWMLIQ